MLGAEKSVGDTIIEMASDGAALPPMPDLGAQLLDLMCLPPNDLAVDGVVQLVRGDAALAARLIRVARSPYYGQNSAAADLDLAVSTIGLRESLAVASFFFLANILPDFRPVGPFTLERFWVHSWTCATAARMLGQPQYLILSQPGDLYIAGLLHDVGKLLFALHTPEQYAECVETAAGTGASLSETERRCLGIDHGTLGAQVLDGWGLPQRILDAVACHHWVEEADPRHQELTGIVEFADLLAIQRDAGPGTGGDNAALSGAWLCAAPQAPLATEDIRDGVVKEILQSLRPKAAILLSGENDLSSVDTQDDGASGNASSTAKIARILADFRAAFAG